MANDSIQDISVTFVGSGGDGIITIGDLLSSSAAKDGLFCFELKSYGPQIRGGESSSHVRISTSPVLTQGDHTDILVVLSWKDLACFEDELTYSPEMVILYDADDPSAKNGFPIKLTGKETIYAIPFKKIAEEKAGSKQSKNIVTLGAVAQLFGFQKNRIAALIQERFLRKGQEVADHNVQAFNAGAEYVASQIEKKDKIKLDFPVKESNLLMSGNEALAYGALYAGCRFYAGYPITPSSEIMHWMSQHLPQYGGTFVQAEDELASIGMVLGASYGGVKAMTATSGPGFSLMQETLGLMAMSETAAVVVDVQRVGPSTGIPTKTEQSDLNIALNGSHGDAPRVVLSVSDVKDCFEVAVDAFNIAEEYQTPVIILSDQLIGQRKESFPAFSFQKFNPKIRSNISNAIKGEFKRFEFTEDGVSNSSVPGIPEAQFINSGLEHNEKGSPSSDTQMHEKMNQKRYQKLENLAAKYSFIRKYGNEKSKLGIITWGSCKGAVREAVQKLETEGVQIFAMVPTLIQPLQKDLLLNLTKNMEKILVIELSYTGQFMMHLCAHLPELASRLVSFRRSGGNPYKVSEIYQAISDFHQKFQTVKML